MVANKLGYCGLSNEKNYCRLGQRVDTSSCTRSRLEFVCQRQRSLLLSNRATCSHIVMHSLSGHLWVRCVVLRGSASLWSSCIDGHFHRSVHRMTHFGGQYTGIEASTIAMRCPRVRGRRGINYPRTSSSSRRFSGPWSGVHELRGEDHRIQYMSSRRFKIFQFHTC